MNMKNTCIPYEIRKLLKEESIKKLTLNIYDKAKEENAFKYYPTKVYDCLDKAYSDKNLFDEDKERYEKNIESCYKLVDNKYIVLLINEKILKGIYNMDESGFFKLEVIKTNIDHFKKLVKWIEEEKYINNYGLFSLNTLTGEAYFNDNKTIFKPATGYYNLFKEFITTKNKCLTFQEIVEIQQLNKSLIKAEDIKNYAREIIKHLKRKLSMKSGSGKLLIMYEKIGYSLLKGV